MLEALIAPFLSDPIKTILGSGGVLGALVLVVRWWRNRSKMRIHNLRETYDTKQSPMIEVIVTVELENVGRETTSIDPTVALRCISADRSVLLQKFSVQDGDRTLAPVTPRSLTLRAEIPANYVFSHFRVFTFSFSRGTSCKWRVLNASGKTAGIFKFNILEWLFRVFNVLPHIPG